MRINLYLHGSKENAYEAGEKAGLTGDALGMFRHAGTEHRITYDVDERGWARPIAIDGRLISDEPFNQEAAS